MHANIQKQNMTQPLINNLCSQYHTKIIYDIPIHADIMYDTPTPYEHNL